MRMRGWIGVVGAALSCAQTQTIVSDGGSDAATIDVSSESTVEAAAPPCTFPEGGPPGLIDDTFALQMIAGSFAPNSMIIDRNGNVYVAGTDDSSTTLGACWNQTTNAVNIVKVLPSGAVDATFGANGHFCIPPPNTDQSILSLAYDPSSDTIVGVGVQSVPNKPSTDSLLVIRIDTKGHLVSSFGTNGVMTLSSDAGANLGTGYAVAIDATFTPAKIVLIGDQWIARLDQSGAPNLEFGGSGVVFTPNESNIALTITADGYYVGGGGAAQGDATVRRFDRSGNPDVLFNGGLLVHVPIIASYAFVWSMTPTPRGIALGIVTKVFTPIIEIHAYTSSGAADTAFGVVKPQIDGGALTPIDLGLSSFLTHDCEGRLLVTGNNNPNVEVLRLEDDGGIDETFGTNGFAAITFNGGIIGHMSAEDPITGRIVVAARTNNLVLARLYR